MYTHTHMVARAHTQEAAMAAAEDELAKKWSRGVGGAVDVASLTYGGAKLDAAVIDMGKRGAKPMLTYTPPEKLGDGTAKDDEKEEEEKEKGQR